MALQWSLTIADHCSDHCRPLQTIAVTIAVTIADRAVDLGHQPAAALAFDKGTQAEAPRAADIRSNEHGPRIRAASLRTPLHAHAIARVALSYTTHRT